MTDIVKRTVNSHVSEIIDKIDQKLDVKVKAATDERMADIMTMMDRIERMMGSLKITAEQQKK